MTRDDPPGRAEEVRLGQANLHNQFNVARHFVDRQTFKQRRSAVLAEWRKLASETTEHEPDCNVEEEVRRDLTAPFREGGRLDRGSATGRR